MVAKFISVSILNEKCVAVKTALLFIFTRGELGYLILLSPRINGKSKLNIKLAFLFCGFYVF